MEERVDSPLEPTADDDSTIWRFIHDKKINEKSGDPINSGFFQEFCDREDVNFEPDQVFEYFKNIMRSDLYKERELAPHEILELYKALKIEISPYQVETLERNFSVFIKLNSHRTLSSWSLPRHEAAKRAYEPVETDDTDDDDVQPKRKRSPLKLERQDSESRSGEGCSHDSPDLFAQPTCSENQEILDLSETIKMETDDTGEVNSEDVKVLKEVVKAGEDSEDVTIERVISGDAEIPKDIEDKMWEYIGSNFEKDRPKRFKTVDFWTIFIAETISDNDTLTPLQLLNHFTKNLLPKLWNHPIRIATRLRILRGLRMPITLDQKKSLEKEFRLKIEVNQLNCIEEWEPRKASEATPRRTPKARVHVPSDSEDEKSPPPPPAPTVTPRRASRTPKLGPRTPSFPKSAHSICKKPVPDPLTGRARRAVFTPGDDESMWKFLLEEIRIGLKPEPKGLELWKRYIDDTECWREPRNLNSHYRKIMTQNLHLVEMPLADKLELYMYTKIPCPADQIREFREKYLINHKNLIITYAKERTDDGFDDEEEEDEEEKQKRAQEDAEEMKIEESDGEEDALEAARDPEASEAPEASRKDSEASEAPEPENLESSIRKSSRATRKPSRLRDSPESRATSESSENQDSTSRKPSRSARKPSKLRDISEEALLDDVDALEDVLEEAPEASTENQESGIRKSSRSTRKPAKLADSPEPDLISAISDAQESGKVTENLFGLVLRALGPAFENGETLDLEKLKTTFAKRIRKCLKKSENRVLRKENKHIVQHLVDVLCEADPENREDAEKLLEATCQKLMDDLEILER